jgi:hypothetical protein
MPSQDVHEKICPTRSQRRCLASRGLLTWLSSFRSPLVEPELPALLGRGLFFDQAEEDAAWGMAPAPMRQHEPALRGSQQPEVDTDRLR